MLKKKIELNVAVLIVVLLCFAVIELVFATHKEDLTSPTVKYRSSNAPVSSTMSPQFTEQEQHWLTHHPVIQVGVDSNFPPYEWIDSHGVYTGLAAEYLTLIQKQLGINFHIVKNKSWPEIESMATRGKLNLVSFLNRSPQRSKYLDFSVPIVSTPMIIINTEKQGYIGSLNKLAGKRIAVEQGYFTAEVLARDYPKIKLIYANSTADAIEKLVNGDADAYVGDAVIANYTIKKFGYVSVQFAGQTSIQSRYRIGIIKNQPELRAIINKALANITPEQREQVENHWMGLNVNRVIRKATVVKYSLGVALLFGLFGYWNYRLRQEIKVRKIMEAFAQRSDQRFRQLLEQLPNISVQGYDKDRRVNFWNKASEDLYGYSAEEARGKRLEDLIIPEDMRDIVINSTKQWMAGGVAIPAGELRLRTKNNQPIDVFSSHVMSRDVNGYPEMYCIDIDLTARKKAELQVSKQANYDALTALPNRNLFDERLQQEIKKSNRTNKPIALFFLDLDKFKEVNDTFGHSVGDRLLVDAAKRISDCVRDVDTVARLGGDEFTIILTDIGDVIGIERIANNIIESLTQPFQLGTDKAYISASIGITLYPNDAHDVDGLLKNADQAMYMAKDAGRGCFRYFTKKMQQSAWERFNLLNDLRDALAKKQLELYYQPIIHLKTGKIHKAEALLRWNHPKKGMISPDKFIPLAEESGLIIGIGRWVFYQAIQQVKVCKKQDPKFQISINKSPIQFREKSDVIAMMEQQEVAGKNIVIEITESLLMENKDIVAEKLLNYRDAGIQVALDDFGTGYSSLAYLNKFDIDYLKIDQLFIRHLRPDSNELALSEAIIVMAHKLGLKVIAEGVETEQQRDLLLAANCDYVQGYLYSKPLPADQFELFLANSLQA